MANESEKVEFERKFLVRGNVYRELGTAVRLVQGYLSTDRDRTVRVRIEDDKRAALTIKGRSSGESQPEFEYEIPVDDARAILTSMCGDAVIDKTRYTVPVGDFEWVVDEFHGANDGLILAEIEAPDRDTLRAAIDNRPDWAITDVTADYRYRNSRLLDRPYASWPVDERAVTV